jgi:hypothetical protein
MRAFPLAWTFPPTFEYGAPMTPQWHCYRLSILPERFADLPAAATVLVARSSWRHPTLDDYRAALAAAAAAGWQGDSRVAARCWWLPDVEALPAFVIADRQACFVVAPVRLPWLEQHG